ncbi:unnamed protein product [Heligmosomoides polygyrus]|uniref:Reverse transcriptase domain-containing protein n=1 Tax=Heligmosomoides polygyrus TaxID=6339 RepID=A0A183FHR5_HELPZ|nr:unnamed protein product [Heligmosomoides polygyrus]
MIDHIHTITKLIEVSYKLPLCLTFIDLKKAFDSVEIEAVMEALCLTFIDLKKAFDSVETEAVMEALLIALRSDLKKAFDSIETEAVLEALLTQDVPTQ